MRTPRTRWIAVLPMLGLLFAGCGGDDANGESDSADTGDAADDGAASEDAASEDEDGDAAGDGDGELTPITVGILPIADLAPLYHAIDEGYFEEEGLDVTMEIGQGGAALVPSVINDDYQFGFGNYISLMLARQNNVPVTIVQHIADGAADPDRGTNALMAAPDSGIESVSDLAGKTFAVSTLNNLAEVNIRTTLRNNDVDDSEVEFVEVPFPDMNGAVESGTVDVNWVPEPFVTLGEGAGLVNIADPMYETMPSMPIAGMFASEEWLADNPELAESFISALRRGLEDAGDEEAMQAAIVANTETPEDLVTQIALANWQADLDVDDLATTGSLAVEYGVLDEEPNMDELVWQGG